MLYLITLMFEKANSQVYIYWPRHGKQKGTDFFRLGYESELVSVQFFIIPPSS
jgi:hypothetical protein